MKEQSLFHVKVDYQEAIQSKKDLLSSQADILRVLKTMKRYNLLRKEELNTRLRIQNKIRDLRVNIDRINDVFPKVKIPAILKKNEVKEDKTVKAKDNSKDRDLESQLREIQERLRKLG